MPLKRRCHERDNTKKVLQPPRFFFQLKTRIENIGRGLKGISASMAKSIKLRCTMKINTILYHLPIKCYANTNFFFQKTSKNG